MKMKEAQGKKFKLILEIFFSFMYWKFSNCIMKISSKCNVEKGFSKFSCMFLNSDDFFNLKSNCSNLLDMRNLQEQVKKAFCYQKLFWPFTVSINFSSDLKHFANSRPSASNFKSFSQSLEQLFLTLGQNNFDNKITKQYEAFLFIQRLLQA